MILHCYCLICIFFTFDIGAALNAMLEFFQSLVVSPLPGLGYRDLLVVILWAFVLTLFVVIE